MMLFLQLYELCKNCEVLNGPNNDELRDLYAISCKNCSEVLRFLSTS